MKNAAASALIVLAFMGCAKPAVLPQPESPVSVPEKSVEIAKPEAASILSAEDENYALYLESVLAKMSDFREEKMLLNYIKYLHYGTSSYAKDYVARLMKEAANRDAPVENVSIF